MKSQTLVILFPGIGYTCDKPLLYYAKKLTQSFGCQVVSLSYGGFPKDAKHTLNDCITIAYQQACAKLSDITWPEDVLFISKSIGTAVALQYANRHDLRVRHVLLTPLVETFSWPVNQAIAFHGTNDPWADTKHIIALCKQNDIPLHLIPHANHSLECGDVHQDILCLDTVMATISDYIRHTSQ